MQYVYRYCIDNPVSNKTVYGYAIVKIVVTAINKDTSVKQITA